MAGIGNLAELINDRMMKSEENGLIKGLPAALVW